MTDLPRQLPPEHPQRRRLADEVHARPPVAIPCPGAAACVALWRPDGPQDDLAPLRDLAQRHGLAIAAQGSAHRVLDLPGVRVKWERHSEFTSYTFFTALDRAPGAPLAWPQSAFAALPPGWLAELPGRTLAAVDVVLLPQPDGAGSLEQVTRMFGGPTLVGSRVAGGTAQVYTDFELSVDGRERWLVLDAGMTRGQQARVAQRLTEIAIYRVTSLLAFPLARELGPALSAAEARLAAATARLAELGRATLSPLEVQREDRRLLDELSQIAAEIERSVGATAYRFSAARAYWDIVNNRVAELREERIGGVATIGEFLARRLAPAINTVLATARRQHDLAERVARASDLLRTRVDVAREEQNQQILAAMDRRGKVSLRMQQTVEGLSVAAITYYAVGLVGYLAKGLKHVWPVLEPDWVTAAAVPLLALLIWRLAHRVRAELMRDSEGAGPP